MDRIQHIQLDEIETAAALIAKQLRGSEILALIGPLGSGKTTFAKALAKALKLKAKVTSPTFTLMHVFPVKLQGKKPAVLYHLDLYRTKNFREVKALGITEIWGRADTVSLIEWADKIKNHLPKKTIFIYFDHNTITKD